MTKGTALRLTGANPEETARVLAQRLIELGRNVEVMDRAMADRLGAGAGFVCRLLSRNGVIVLVVSEDVRPDCECMSMAIDANDTPDFAAEKILDELSRRNLVLLDTHEYTPEEEEEIRRRLADLGYIE